MKLHINSREDVQAGTLFVTLFTCLAIGIVLASILTLTLSRNKVIARSASWNSALPVLEAGIEEALTHLQRDTNNPSANGWDGTNISGQVVYEKTRTFSDGSSFYATIYNPNSSGATIYSTGRAPAPLGTGYITRTVRVLATNPPSLFSKAIAANGPIRMTGSAYVDSYDSRQGPYNTTSNRTANGNIATNSRGTPAVSVGGNVYGTVSTGPGGTVSVKGAVGDVAWDSSHGGIEDPSWTNDTMNVAFPTNSPPTGGPFPTTTTTSVGGSNIVYLGDVTNQISSFSSTDSKKPMIVTGHAVLYVTGDFKISGTGYLLIQPGATLTLYLGGTASISGGGIANGTGLPQSLSLIGLSSCASIDYSGNSSFIGTVNAPQADFTLSGGAEAYGAAICNSYTTTGNSGWHYDTSLGSGGIFVATGYTEL
jgi:hypothetical protein